MTQAYSLTKMSTKCAGTDIQRHPYAVVKYSLSLQVYLDLTKRIERYFQQFSISDNVTKSDNKIAHSMTLFVYFIFYFYRATLFCD